MADLKRFSFLLTLFLALFLIISPDLVAARKEISPEASELGSRLKDAQKDFIDFYKTTNNASFLSARVKLERLLAKYPKNVTVKMFLGMLYNMKAQSIADDLSKRTDINPKSFFQIGNLFLAQNRYAEAVDCYKKVVKAYPKWSCPHRHMGEALMKMNKDDEAIVALEKSVETRKNHYDAYVWLAKVLVKVGKYDKAEKNLKTAVAVAKKNGICTDEAGEAEASMADVYSLYAQIYKATGDEAKCKIYENKLSKLEK